MSEKNIKAKNGFTIIEVVLVLAIAGLIFLMVFIALPQLQRAQRDTQRRSDLAKVATAITQYQTNNKGKLPSTGLCNANSAAAIVPSDSSTYSSKAACKFIATYLNSSSSDTNEFVDPDGTYYKMRIARPSGSAGNSSTYHSASNMNHIVNIIEGSKCDDQNEGYYVLTGNQNDYAITYKLEGSGVYCADNQ